MLLGHILSTVEAAGAAFVSDKHGGRIIFPNAVAEKWWTRASAGFYQLLSHMMSEFLEPAKKKGKKEKGKGKVLQSRTSHL